MHEDKLKYISDCKSYLINNLKYNANIDINRIENVLIIYGLYQILIKLDLTESERKHIESLYNCMRSIIGDMPKVNVNGPESYLLLQDSVTDTNRIKQENNGGK